MTPPIPSEIRASREAAGLTQREAAEVAGVALRTWQAWEQPDGASARQVSARRWQGILVAIGRAKEA